MKKVITLFLALALVLGTAILPSPALAKGNSNEFQEADYKVENVNGASYKVYEFTDVVGKPAPKKSMKIGDLEISQPRILNALRGSNPALGEEIPNADRYAVDVQWTTYDLQPDKLGTPVHFLLYDKTSKKIIAQTEDVTQAGLAAAEKQTSQGPTYKYKFKKLPAWDESGVSHDPDNWQVRAPNEYRFDVRLKTGMAGNASDNNITANIGQRGMPIYRAEYYTNKTEPSITVERTNKKDNTKEVSINSKNLGENQYYSWAEAPEGGKTFFEGRLLDIQKYGDDSLESLQVSELITAGRVKMAMKAPGKTDFDRGPGTFEDNGTPYHYEVTGDHIKLHIFTIRQDLKVKFDANGGTWNNSAPADQTIGHSMKLGDEWAGLGPITVPGENDLTPPAAEPGKPEKTFIGWNTDKDATTALFTDNTYAQPITNDETFYAIYAEKAQGIAKVKYNLAGTVKEASELDAKYKIDGQGYPAELKGNLDEKIADAVFDKTKAPKFIGYEIESIKTDPVPNPPATANYTKNGDYTVIYKYKKLDAIIPEKTDDGQDNPKVTKDVKATYIPVTIKVDTNKGQFKKAGAAKTEAEFKYYVNPVEDKSLEDVLTASGLTPEVKDANAAQIDTAKPWKFTPDKTEGQAPADVALGTKIDKENFKKTKAVTMEVNFKQTKADQLKGKLEPKDIKVWVGDDITWKEGVKLNAASENDNALKTLLAEANVTDENGRNSDAANLPKGTSGTLKLTFDDNSSLTVENQMLYVSPVKVKKDNTTDETKLPDNKIQVDIKLGEGVQAGTMKGKTTPVVYASFYLKPNTGLAGSDFPAVEAQQGYKENSVTWTPAEQTKAWDTNGAYVATAKKQTIAEKVGKDNLAGVDFGVWQGDPINWKKGVKAAEGIDETLKTAIEGYLNDAKTVVSDKTTPARTSATAGKFPGKLTVKFSDNSTLEVEKQTLYVWEHKTVNNNNNKNDPKPEDAIQVSFAKGKGVTALNPENKTMTVKPNTTLAMSDFPAATVDQANGYADQALWTGKVANLGKKVTAENNVFTATAQKRFDDNNIADIAFVKDPDKMSYNEGEPLQLAGLEIKLTDKHGTEKMIGVDELAKYKITIEPKDGTTLTIKDHNGTNLVAKGKVKTAAGEVEKMVTSPGKLDVHEKRSGGFFFFPPATTEEKHETAIHKAYIFGYEDDSFKPEGNMTRAEAAAMLARLQGLDLSNEARPDFMDVRSGWYNGSINAVVSAGYMKGYPDNTFRPNGKITRAEFAQMIKAIDKANTGVAPFADVKGHWAEAAINQAYANGRIAGYPDSTFRPNNNITRAEAVTVFNKLYDRSVSEAGLVNVKNSLVDFNDISRGHWAYYQVVEASNTHEYYRTVKDKVDETWVKIIQTWKDILAHR